MKDKTKQGASGWQEQHSRSCSERLAPQKSQIAQQRSLCRSFPSASVWPLPACLDSLQIRNLLLRFLLGTLDGIYSD